MDFTDDELRTIESVCRHAAADRRKRLARLSERGRRFVPAPGHRDTNVAAIEAFDRIAEKAAAVARARESAA